MSAALRAARDPSRPVEADINLFHDTHFSLAAVQLFETQFLVPTGGQDDGQYWDDGDAYCEELDDDYDDGLGYYPDGVKRTLTDEQIAIFRHSELESLRRSEAKATELQKVPVSPPEAAGDETAAKDCPGPQNATSSPTSPRVEGPSEADGKKGDEVQEASEDGEIETDIPTLTKAEARRNKKLRTRRKKQEQRKFNPEKKPDLRKRTWDVVEAGMDGLDYDELESSGDASAAPAAQRRRISYDD
ncbi:hypothetical protein GGS23DRAFT_619353 [Durotheca rogersii]|uniref:uncharacterized protein n=1 Tax=Durotheca rogersii TaxID=419775 RepID=UPI002221154C|nr:uncharacterized protein GGS23DRAFT_619353 [Durotheca rogersii]KAI5864699.1 hypothetical protein GGS23DRAFT_619353 [Durotheca rogersii]